MNSERKNKKQKKLYYYYYESTFSLHHLENCNQIGNLKRSFFFHFLRNIPSQKLFSVSLLNLYFVSLF